MPMNCRSTLSSRRRRAIPVIVLAVRLLLYIVSSTFVAPAVAMFRTAVRRFATSAVRSAEAGAPSAHLIEIAKAQRIATGGFIDGM